jgi:hypothetical protein
LNCSEWPGLRGIFDEVFNVYQKGKKQNGQTVFVFVENNRERDKN